jgi:hypothetical protein
VGKKAKAKAITPLRARRHSDEEEGDAARAMGGRKKKKGKAPRTCSLIGLAIDSMDWFFLFFTGGGRW